MRAAAPRAEISVEVALGRHRAVLPPNAIVGVWAMTLVTEDLIDRVYEAAQTPEALGALQKARIEKWWPLITEFGIKTE